MGDQEASARTRLRPWLCPLSPGHLSSVRVRTQGQPMKTYEEALATIRAEWAKVVASAWKTPVVFTQQLQKEQPLKFIMLDLGTHFPPRPLDTRPFIAPIEVPGPVTVEKSRGPSDPMVKYTTLGAIQKEY